MSTFTSHTVPDFTDADLDGVLAGAALLEDIERFRKVKVLFETDQERAEHRATVTLPDNIKAVGAHISLEAWITAGVDPHVEIDKLIARRATLDAEITATCEGTAAKKLERRFGALIDFHSDLSARLSVYQANLGTNTTMAMLLDDGDEDGEPDGKLEAQA